MAKREKTKARPAWSEGLDDREYNFVREYLVDLNGTKAALRAGVTADERSARQRAYEMVHRPHVSLAIDQAITENASGPRQWLVRKLANIADADVRDLVEWDDKGGVTFKATKDLPPEITALVKKIHRTKDGEVRLELHDPLRAIEMLAKVGSISLTREKVSIEGSLTLDSIIRESYEPKG